MAVHNICAGDNLNVFRLPVSGSLRRKLPKVSGIRYKFARCYCPIRTNTSHDQCRLASQWAIDACYHRIVAVN